MKSILIRLGHGALVIWGAFTVSFVILYLIPGDSVTALLSADGGTYVNPEDEQRLRESLGLDAPFIVQYLTRVVEYLTGDFGTSVRYGAPVAELLWQAIPSTIFLTVTAMVLSVIFGVGFAILVTFFDTNRLAQAARILPAFGSSVPSFWIALILLQLFSFRWQIFPAQGETPWYAVVLPAVTIAIAYSSMIAQVTIDGVLRSKSELYVRTAVSKGLSRREVHLRHIVPSSLLPTISVIGVNFGTLLAGAVISEAVYSRRGLGSLMQISVLQRDLPLVQGTIVVSAIVFVLVNLLTDSIYPLVDPRARRVA